MIPWSMKNWVWGTIGTAVLVFGLGLSALGFFRPGLECAEDDVSAGCPATPTFAVMSVAGILLIPASIPLLIRAGKTQKIPFEAAGKFGRLPAAD